MLKDSESDDLAAVLDVMIELFPEELQPYSVQLLEALVRQLPPPPPYSLAQTLE